MHPQIKDTKKTYTQPPEAHVATSPPPLSVGCADVGWALPVLQKSQAEESWGSSCWRERCWHPAASSCSVLQGRRARRCHDFTQQPDKGTRNAHSGSRAAACRMLTHSPSRSLFRLHLRCRAALQHAVNGKANLGTSSGSLFQTSVGSQLSWKAMSWPVGATWGKAEGMCPSPQSSAR